MPAPAYSYDALCSTPSCPTCPAYNLGLVSVDPEAGSCHQDAWDPYTGEPARVDATGLSDGQIAACKALIVTGPYYPSSCPR